MPVAMSAVSTILVDVSAVGYKKNDSTTFVCCRPQKCQWTQYSMLLLRVQPDLNCFRLAPNEYVCAYKRAHDDNKPQWTFILVATTVPSLF